jgi:hypothetical protein
MGTAHATLNFESSKLGPCITWMTRTHSRINAHRASRRTAPVSSTARGVSHLPGDPNFLCDSKWVGIDEVTQ